jgi:hypothetical protein
VLLSRLEAQAKPPLWQHLGATAEAQMSAWLAIISLFLSLSARLPSELQGNTKTCMLTQGVCGQIQRGSQPACF